MLRQTLLSFLALVTLALPQVYAQAPATSQSTMPSVDPALFKGLRYRLVGPSRGGRVTTVTGVPSQPRTFSMVLLSGTPLDTTRATKARRPKTPSRR